MKKSLALFTMIALFSFEINGARFSCNNNCYALTYCQTFIMVSCPEDGTCNTYNQDKYAEAVSYDNSGCLVEFEDHDCEMGPC